MAELWRSFKKQGEAWTPVHEEPAPPTGEGLSTPRLDTNPNSLAFSLPLLLPTPAALKKQRSGQRWIGLSKGLGPKQIQRRVAVANSQKEERHEKLKEAKQRERNQDLSAHGVDGHNVNFM